MLKNNRKKVSIAAGLVIALIVGGAAYAYWTAGGSGTGSASTGTTVPITANQTSTVSNLRPAGTAQTLSGTFTSTNAGPVYVASVAAAVTGTDKVGCDASDYTLSGSPVTVGAEVTTGSTWGAGGTMTIAFNDKPGTNQDACKGAAVTIGYTVN